MTTKIETKPNLFILVQLETEYLIKIIILIVTVKQVSPWNGSKGTRRASQSRMQRAELADATDRDCDCSVPCAPIVHQLPSGRWTTDTSPSPSHNAPRGVFGIPRAPLPKKEKKKKNRDSRPPRRRNGTRAVEWEESFQRISRTPIFPMNLLYSVILV